VINLSLPMGGFSIRRSRLSVRGLPNECQKPQARSFPTACQSCRRSRIITSLRIVSTRTADRPILQLLPE